MWTVGESVLSLVGPPVGRRTTGRAPDLTRTGRSSSATERQVPRTPDTHVGMGMIWPMSLITRALTSDDDTEIKSCLVMLKTSQAGTGFMHEAFNRDDASHFTRPWFAWSNTLLGELLWKIYREKPALLASVGKPPDGYQEPPRDH